MFFDKPDGKIEIELHDAVCPPDQEHSLQLNSIVHWFRTNLNTTWRKHWSGSRLVKLARESETVSFFEEHLND